jgi:hypothetical protein
MEDSRVRLFKPRGVKPLVRLPELGIVHGEPLYCVGCGKQHGWVTFELPPGVVYECDECVAKYGEAPGLVPRPDLDERRVLPSRSMK